MVKKNFPARLKSTSTARPSATNFPLARTVSHEWSPSFLSIQSDLIAFLSVDVALQESVHFTEL